MKNLKSLHNIGLSNYSINALRIVYNNTTGQIVGPPPNTNRPLDVYLKKDDGRWTYKNVYRLWDSVFTNDYYLPERMAYFDLTEDGYPGFKIAKNTNVYKPNNEVLKCKYAADGKIKSGVTKWGNVKYTIPTQKIYRKYFQNYIMDVPEEMKRSLDFLGYPNYIITKIGDVWSISNYKYLSSTINKGKYLKVTIVKDRRTKKSIEIHRLLALAFIPIPDEFKDIPLSKMHAHHIDEDTFNNNIIDVPSKGLKCNIQWTTTSIHRSNHNDKSITDEQVHIICQGIADGLESNEIIRKAKCSARVVTQIKTNGYYNYISKDYDFSKARKYRTSDEIVVKICEELITGIPFIEIARKLNVGVTIVERIANRKLYTNISDNYKDKWHLIRSFKKYPPEVIHNICKLAVTGKYKRSGIAKELNIPLQLVHKILSKTSHTKISKNYDI